MSLTWFVAMESAEAIAELTEFLRELAIVEDCTINPAWPMAQIYANDEDQVDALHQFMSSTYPDVSPRETAEANLNRRSLAHTPTPQTFYH